MAKTPPSPSPARSGPLKARKRPPAVHGEGSGADFAACGETKGLVIRTDIPEHVTCERCLKIALRAHVLKTFPGVRKHVDPAKYTQTRVVGQSIEVEKPREPTCGDA